MNQDFNAMSQPATLLSVMLSQYSKLLAVAFLVLLNSCVLFGFDRVEERDGKRWLYGGNEPGQAFDITEFRLDPKKLNFGLGREAFHALVDPKFGLPGDPGVSIHDRTRILGVVIDGEAKAYPIHLLRGHEVVNDTVGGRPIFAAYCILADLAAVYDREMAGHIFTFGVSGYTYADKSIWRGLNAFVLWDRDTESLWLPTIGKGVSGPMIDVPMQLSPQAGTARRSFLEESRRQPLAKHCKAPRRLSRSITRRGSATGVGHSSWNLPMARFIATDRKSPILCNADSICSTPPMEKRTLPPPACFVGR